MVRASSGVSMSVGSRLFIGTCEILSSCSFMLTSSILLAVATSVTVDVVRMAFMIVLSIASIFRMRFIDNVDVVIF